MARRSSSMRMSDSSSSPRLWTMESSIERVCVIKSRWCRSRANARASGCLSSSALAGPMHEVASFKAMANLTPMPVVGTSSVEVVVEVILSI